MELQSDISFWWAALALVLGSLTSLWYYRIKSNKRRILLPIRLCSLAILALLLVNPYSITKIEHEIHPKTVVLIDQSLSIDSIESGQVLSQLKTIAEEYKDKEVVFQPFSSGLNHNKRTETDITAAIKSVLQRDRHRLEELIIITDGVSTKGANPLYEVQDYFVPISSIALGDSAKKIDLSIEYIKAPKEANEGSVVPFDIIVRGPKNLKKCKATFSFNNKKTEHTILLQNGIGRLTLNRVFEPKAQDFVKGIVKLEVLEDESNVLNNSKVIYIKNKKSEYTIDLVYDAPHPDISVWQRALVQLKNTDVNLIPSTEYTFSSKPNHLAILFAYKPSTKLDNKFDVHIIGNEKLKSGNFNGLPIEFNSAKVNSNVTPRFEEFDNIFTINGVEDLNSIEYKSVEMPFGVLTLSGESQNIISQNTDGMENSFPLLATFKLESKNTAVYFGEGLWQFATAFKLLSESTETSIETVLNNLVMYLLKNSGQERLEIFQPTEILADESQGWTINVINQNNENVRNASVSVQIKDDKGALIGEYAFSENQSYYQAQIAGLTTGIYTYIFSARINNKTITTTKKILVEEVGLELLNTQANYSMLQALSDQTGGRFLTSKTSTEQSLKTLFNTTNSGTVVYKNEKKYWADYWVIWLTLLTLLSAEWLIRRRNGLI